MTTRAPNPSVIDIIGASPTLAVEEQARSLRRAGRSVVSFAAGEPDFPTPAHVVEAARRACREPEAHRYGPTQGIEVLRVAIAGWMRSTAGSRYDPSEILVTNGAKQAIHHAFAALCGTDDEVIVPAPYWPTYVAAVRLAGATPVIADSSPRAGWRVDVEQLEALRTERTRAIVFASPANPTGAVASPEEVSAIAAWAARHGIWVVADEIYSQLVGGEASAPSMPALAPVVHDRCVVVNGVSKAYAMTGWRVGWLAGPAQIVRTASRLQSHVTSHVNNVAQHAATAALEGDQACVERMRAAYDCRRRLLYDALMDIDGIDCVEPRGAFYAFPSFAAYLGRSLRGRRIDSTVDLAGALLREAGVAVVAGEAFGAPGHARLACAVSESQIADGVGRISAYLTD